MLNLFKKTPVLEEESIQWLFNGYEWALSNFGSDVFFNETQLIEPSKAFFPGGGDSMEEMAETIFRHVQTYAGLSYWPCQTISHYDYDDTPPAQNALAVVQGQSEQALLFFYEPQQVANPDAMIANYAHALGHHLRALAQQPPPCEDPQWPHMAELVATHMGFGIMMVNSARPKKAGGCGSCHNPALDRQGFLTEAEAAYALAIFCVLKNIPPKKVAPRLHDYMRSYFKKAVKDAESHSAEISRLRAINSPSMVRGKKVSSTWQNKSVAASTGSMHMSVNFQTPEL